MKTREITLIGISVSLMIIIGYVFYTMASIIIIPGSRYVLMAPLLGFMFCIPLFNIRKIGTISLVSLVFGLIMMFINIFMSVAIISSGILTDTVSYILFRNYNNNKSIICTSAFYPLFSLVTSFWVSNYITGNKAYLMINKLYILISVSIITYILGLIGSYFGYKVMVRINKRTT
ncbi:hypothetical protein [Alkalithermobacter paradoxus]|uniref:Energy-coupling factor transport system substrate-specific component n=1 Tax=Alkalithermobacter paradoxus TaxID=29349 RepID=A0A1V4I5Q8_9FIRM|nr:hypothetical protein CLOTH_17670 [[Clostridium] thermoalcaliphilum]